MSNLRQGIDHGVLVRFWSLDHHRAEPVLWPVSPWPKLVYAAEGTLQVETDQQLWILPANRALWVDAGESHRSATLGKARVRTLYFSPSMNIQQQNGILDVPPLLRELIVESCSAGPLIAGDSRLEALAILLQFEVEKASMIPSGIVMPQSDWMREWASQFIDNPLEPPPCSWSRRTMERQMLKETGLTLGQWCQQARAVVGLRALSTGATVGEAAVEAGFATSSGFVHSFRKRFGTTPGSISRDLLKSSQLETIPHH